MDKDVMARSDRNNRRYMKEETSWAGCTEEGDVSVAHGIYSHD